MDIAYCHKIEVMLALASAGDLTPRFYNVGPLLYSRCEHERQRCVISESYLLSEHMRTHYPKDGPTWMKTLEVQRVFI